MGQGYGKKYDATKKVAVVKPGNADMRHREKPIDMGKLTGNQRLIKKVGG